MELLTKQLYVFEESLRLYVRRTICPAAGQVVENTPCPAVNFLLIFIE